MRRRKVEVEKNLKAARDYFHKATAEGEGGGEGEGEGRKRNRKRNLF